MSMHMVAYRLNVLTAGVVQALTPVPDSTVTISGTDIYIPDKYNQIISAGCLVTSGVVTRAQLRSPSLREMWYPEINPQKIGPTWTGANPLSDWRDNPIQLITNEGLNFFSDGGGDGTTASDCYGIVNLSGSKASVASGKMFALRATSASTLALGSWAQSSITFDQTLPVGNYDIVGMRAEGVGLVAARLLFIGASAVTRPGVIGVASSNVARITNDRYGLAGIFGTFNSITPPSVECLGDTGTAQSFVFDLIKR